MILLDGVLHRDVEDLEAPLRVRVAMRCELRAWRSGWERGHETREPIALLRHRTI